MAFHPELAGIARWLPRGVARSWTLPLFRAIPTPRARLPAGVTLDERRVNGVPVRVIGAPGARAAVLWIHGGGYVIGAAAQDDAVCASMAQQLGVAVVSVDYRLAPEHPFPAPLDDCFAAYDALDDGPVVVAGQSAGGGLAAALVQRLCDAGRRRPALQALVYPMLDDRTVLRPPPVDPRMWDAPSNAFGWRSYLGRDPTEDAPPPYAAPGRRDDLAGLPPAWIGVGTADLFHDEDVAYAARLRAAGVPVTLEVVPGAFHGFETVAPRAAVSRAFVASLLDAMRAAIAPAPG